MKRFGGKNGEKGFSELLEDLKKQKEEIENEV